MNPALNPAGASRALLLSQHALSLLKTHHQAAVLLDKLSKTSPGSWHTATAVELQDLQQALDQFKAVVASVSESAFGKATELVASLANKTEMLGKLEQVFASFRGELPDDISVCSSFIVLIFFLIIFSSGC